MGVSNTLQNLGARVVLDEIEKLLADRGIEVPSFEVTFKNGEMTTIASDTHPALNRSMDEVEKIVPKTGADSGAFQMRC